VEKMKTTNQTKNATRKDIENEFLRKERRIIEWERTHLLPDLSEVFVTGAGRATEVGA
jgi:hypothetical protein